MTDVMAPVRRQILRLATSGRARRLVQAPRVSQEVVSRFIAGETSSAALDVAASLLARGRLVSLTPLVQPPVEDTQASHRAEFYAGLVADLGRAGMGRGRSEVSMTLTDLGGRLGSSGPRTARALTRQVAQAAGNAGVLLTVETEESVAVDETLAVVEDLRQDHPDVGVALQANRARTVADCRDLAVPGSRVRLSEGAADGSVGGFDTRAEVDRSFVRAMRVLMEGPGYPALATPDLRILSIAEALANHLGRSAESYEYHMRYGVRTETQIVIADRGDRMRVSVPFGPDWYDYLVQRIVDQPAQLADLVRAAAGR